MKLVKAEVQRYRSFTDAVSVDLAEGINVLVGRNNAGKSNFLRAVTLAMDEAAVFVPEEDAPAQLAWSVPKVTLEFDITGSTSPEKTLRAYLREYEIAVGTPSGKTFAEAGLLRFVVEFRSGVRQEYFQAARMGGRRLTAEDERLVKALRQFRRTTRFVLIRSGESLESLLAGRFRDILHLVIRDHLRDGVLQAESQRAAYVEGLRDSLLTPLTAHVSEVVARLFPDIKEVDLAPQVPSLDRTLSEMQIRLGDAALTDLRNKGTGVRGGVLLALLRYLAEESKRSLILAVEEPEAFLHPEAQDSLREGLESLACGKDVTLMITTHSPFLLSRAVDSKVITIQKNGDGVSSVTEGTPAEVRTAALTELFRDDAVGALLDGACEFSMSDQEAVLLVEGATDESYLRTAARLLGREALLERVKIEACGGAQKVTLQALVQNARLGCPIFVLLDTDEMGRNSSDKLKSILQWKTTRQIIRLDQLDWHRALNEVEAEDLWPPRLWERFVEEHGPDVVSETKRIPRTTETRYGFGQFGKERVGVWVERHAKQDDCLRWDALLTKLEERLDALKA